MVVSLNYRSIPKKRVRPTYLMNILRDSFAFDFQWFKPTTQSYSTCLFREESDKQKSLNPFLLPVFVALFSIIVLDALLLPPPSAVIKIFFASGCDIHPIIYHHLGYFCPTPRKSKIRKLFYKIDLVKLSGEPLSFVS